MSVREPVSRVTVDGAEVGAVSWSVQRDLTGGSVPGQARFASGFSIGSGDVVYHDASDLPPWSAGIAVPTGDLVIEATEDSGALEPVARMTVSKLGAPSALSRERTLQAGDVVPRADLTMPLLVSSMIESRAVGARPLDASWIIDRCARAMGYYATPPTVPSAVVSVPGVGSMLPEVGAWGLYDLGDRFFETVTDADGRAVSFFFFGAGGGATPYYDFSPLPAGSTFYVTTTVPGSARSSEDVPVSSAVSLNGLGLFRFYEDGVGGLIDGGTGGTYPPDALYTLDETRRAQVQIEWTSTTSVRYRARAAAGTWSAWVTKSGTTAASSGRLFAPAHVALLGLQIHTADDPGVWGPPAGGRWARIASCYSPLEAIPPVSGDAWSIAQRAAAATMGALAFDETGALVYLDRERLRGMVPKSARPDIVAETDLAELPWSISTSDVADRVEVSYQPPDVEVVTNDSITVWRSESVVAIGPGSTKTLYADLDYSVDKLADWLDVRDTSVPAARMSRWAASYQRAGGGTAPPTNALVVTAQLVTPMRARITIRNATSSTLYTAGDDGTTQLTLRANAAIRPGDAVTLAAGVDADDARAPLQVDLGPYVQDEATARLVLRWLTDATAKPLPTLSNVEIAVPDLSLQVGAVRTMRDPSYTGVVAKVLVTSVSLSASASPYGLTQTAGFVILDVLVYDVDEWLYDEIGSALVSEVDAAIIAALGPGATVGEVMDWLAKGPLDD